MEPNTENQAKNGGIIGIIIVLLVIIIGAGSYLYYNKAAAPSMPGDSMTDTPSDKYASNCGITVKSPMIGDSVSFPLTVTGTVDNSKSQELGCSWALFEGQAGSVTLHYETKDGWSLPVDTKPLKVEGDWMTAGPVVFTATLNFGNTTQLPSGYNFKIVLTEENPSGKGTPDSVEIPLVLK